MPGCIKIILHSLRLKGHCPQGPHSHILLTGGGPSDFFGSEILAKSDFLGSIKDTGIFLGRGKKKKQEFLGVAKKGLRDF